MDYFPITIAQGKAFCNREKERYLLKQCIVNNRHTVIIAPRRYGKTSLINQTLLELKLPYGIMELTLATTIKDIEQLIIKHISNLLYSILPKSEKAIKKILSIFKWLNPELVLSAKGQKIIFHPDWSRLGVIDSIVEILQKMDEAAGVANKKVVLVMDEFQQLSEIGENSQEKEYAIEAAIRSAMQYAKHTSYIFSGSHRQMLISMFNNKNRPFYNSCEVMTIERIERTEHESFIQQAAKERWGKPVASETLDKIFDLTERHPNYINRLCGYFWITKKYPTLQKVKEHWANLVQSNRSVFTEDILSVSKNQRKLLSYLAHSPEAQISSVKVCRALNISEASIRQALKILLARDYIYKATDGKYRILDPAMRDLIVGIS